MWAGMYDLDTRHLLASSEMLEDGTLRHALAVPDAGGIVLFSDGTMKVFPAGVFPAGEVLTRWSRTPPVMQAEWVLD